MGASFAPTTPLPHHPTLPRARTDLSPENFSPVFCLSLATTWHFHPSGGRIQKIQLCLSLSWVGGTPVSPSQGAGFTTPHRLFCTPAERCCCNIRVHFSSGVLFPDLACPTGDPCASSRAYPDLEPGASASLMLSLMSRASPARGLDAQVELTCSSPPSLTLVLC